MPHQEDVAFRATIRGIGLGPVPPEMPRTFPSCKIRFHPNSLNAQIYGLFGSSARRDLRRGERAKNFSVTVIASPAGNKIELLQHQSQTGCRLTAIRGKRSGVG